MKVTSKLMVQQLAMMDISIVKMSSVETRTLVRFDCILHAIKFTLYALTIGSTGNGNSLTMCRHNVDPPETEDQFLSLCLMYICIQ